MRSQWLTLLLSLLPFHLVDARPLIRRCLLLLGLHPVIAPAITSSNLITASYEVHVSLFILVLLPREDLPPSTILQKA